MPAGAPFELDTYSLFRGLLHDINAREAVPVIARRFHASLIAGLADMAQRFYKKLGIAHVALSGKVMQNLTFAQELPKALAQRGMIPLTHKLLPPNDGCISLGQAAYGQRLLTLRGSCPI